MRVMHAICFAITLAVAVVGRADNNSPVGLWKTFDDTGKTAKALVRITEQNGVLQGKIEKLILPPSVDQHPVCLKCKGERQGQALIGMVILSHLKRINEEYGEGTIYDPEAGETYQCNIKLVDSGRKMSVRGYIGVPMLGRSQIWQREE